MKTVREAMQVGWRQRLRAICLPALLLAVACQSNKPQELEAGAPFEERVTVEVLFEGASNFSDADLNEAIAPDLEELHRRSSLAAAVDDAAYSLEVFYREQGFPDCQVDYAVQQEVAGKSISFVLTLDEGPRVRIGELRFSGQRAFRGNELEPFFKPQKRNLFGTAPNWFVQRKFERGLGTLEAYYRSLGYLQASAVLRDPLPGQGEWSERLDLRIDISEGPRSLLRELELRGGLDAHNQEFLDRGWVGRPFTPSTRRALRTRLRETYFEAGYPDVQIELLDEQIGGQGDVRLVLGVNPGPRVRIGAIELLGLERTGEARVLGNLEFEVGDYFSSQKRRDSFLNLYRLGVFGGVSVNLEDPKDAGRGQPATELDKDGSDSESSEPEVGQPEPVSVGPRDPAEPPPTVVERTLVVELEELPGREIFVEPGYGSYEGPRAVIGWRESNLLGTARALRIQGNLSELAQRATVDLVDPRFLNGETAAVFSVFGGKRREPAFDWTELGAQLGLSRRFSEDFELGYGYQLRRSEVDAIDLTDPDVAAASANVNISSLYLSPVWDRRDSSFLPKDGSLASVNLEFGNGALGSELDFLRARLQLAWFRPLGAGLVAGASWRSGLIAPIQSTDVIPLQERFFNGGENSVRSFREDDLGPLDSNDDPLGGEAYNIFNIELRQELAARFEAAMFWDLGNVEPRYQDVLDFRGLRQGLGVGLRYALPIGPVRLDLGFNPDRRSGESSTVLHLSVGLAF